MENQSGRPFAHATLPRMPDGLRPYFDHVWPVFWPWLIWNLVRFARWHVRTGQDALLAVDCFGNIRIVRLCDPPQAEAAYLHEAPRRPRWLCAALAGGQPECLSEGSDGLVPPTCPARIIPACVRSLAGLPPGRAAQARAPP
ncbi:MAG: hypothetical protein R3C00_08865 [Hyphomonas sp.]